jgi:hypothetical protein
MNYTTKRIEEVYENEILTAVNMAVCVNDGITGATREVSVADLEAYKLDKEGVLKALAIETAALMAIPEATPEKEVVALEEVAITKDEVDDKKAETVQNDAS